MRINQKEQIRKFKNELNLQEDRIDSLDHEIERLKYMLKEASKNRYESDLQTNSEIYNVIENHKNHIERIDKKVYWHRYFIFLIVLAIIGFVIGYFSDDIIARIKITKA